MIFSLKKERERERFNETENLSVTSGIHEKAMTESTKLREKIFG